MPPRKSPRLSAALAAALCAGSQLRRQFRKKQEISFKGKIDLVTAMDRRAEATILKVLEETFPEDSFISEEGRDAQRVSPQKLRQGVWLIDPLDGTTNYAHGVPFYAVSIAYYRKPWVEVGVVYNPQLRELFTAVRGGGAWLNGRKISVSSRRKLDAALVATGFPYDVRTHRENNLDYFARAQLSTRGVRRLGAASLDLAYVASGVFDAYWELRLKAWDVAAGALLAQEAGGRVTTLRGKPFSPFARSYLASNGILHSPLQSVLVGKKRGA